MVFFNKKWKKYNEIQLTKNKMDLNNQKWKLIQPPLRNALRFRASPDGLTKARAYTPPGVATPRKSINLPTWPYAYKPTTASGGSFLYFVEIFKDNRIFN